MQPQSNAAVSRVIPVSIPEPTIISAPLDPALRTILGPPERPPMSLRARLDARADMAWEMALDSCSCYVRHLCVEAMVDFFDDGFGHAPSCFHFQLAERRRRESITVAQQHYARTVCCTPQREGRRTAPVECPDCHLLQFTTPEAAEPTVPSQCHFCEHVWVVGVADGD